MSGKGYSEAFRPPSRIGFSPRPDEQDHMGFVKHSEFYFADGSLAIRISGTVFKVHSTILARHSEVFKDMADIPQPDQCETVDGVPVVDLQDDVKEFEETLHTMYDPFYFDSLGGTGKLTDILAFVSGPLRITTKYAMPKLRAKCISLLEAKFPSTLDGCLALLKSHFQYDSADIVRLITLASPSHANVPSVLPWAYYLCTHMGVDEVITNDVLTWEGKALVLAGKEKLWQALRKHSHKMLFQFVPAPACTSNCASKVAQQLNMPYSYNAQTTSGGPYCKFSMSLEEAEELRKIPHPLEEYDSERWKQSAVCARCFAHLGQVHREGRMRVWKELPTYFGLGSWESIQRVQSA